MGLGLATGLVIASIHEKRDEIGGSCNRPLAGRALKRRIRSALKNSDRHRFRARTDRPSNGSPLGHLHPTRRLACRRRTVYPPLRKVSASRAAIGSSTPTSGPTRAVAGMEAACQQHKSRTSPPCSLPSSAKLGSPSDPVCLRPQIARGLMDELLRRASTVPGLLAPSGFPAERTAGS